ncbi:heavy metal-associated domain-containing protein [Planococcus sp. APC 4015]|nr:heavy metal-associated domain-containing protein [Planococcus sp. APC 4015]
MTTTEFQVTGMTCGHCETSVRDEVSKLPGVENVNVSARTGALTVSSTDPVDPDAVLAAVSEAGYTATPA